MRALSVSRRGTFSSLTALFVILPIVASLLLVFLPYIASFSLLLVCLYLTSLVLFGKITRSLVLALSAGLIFLGPLPQATIFSNSMEVGQLIATILLFSSLVLDQLGSRVNNRNCPIWQELRPVLVFGGAFAAIASISVLVGGDIKHGGRQLLRFLAAALFFLTAIRSRPDDATLRAWLWFFAGGGMISSLATLLHFWQPDMFSVWFQYVRLNEQANLITLHFWETQSRFGGIWIFPNMAAEIAAIGLLSVAGLFLDGKILREKVVLLGMGAILAVGGALDNVRGETYAFLLAFVLLLIFSSRRLGLVKMVIIVGISWVVILVIERLSTSLAFSPLVRLNPYGSESILQFSNRLRHYSDLLSIFASHPIIGVGYGTVQYFTADREYAHNMYLGLLAETGILGSSALVTLGVALMKGLAKAIVYSQVAIRRGLQITMLCIVLLFGFSAMVSVSYVFWHIPSLIGMTLGLIFGNLWYQRMEEETFR